MCKKKEQTNVVDSIPTSICEKNDLKLDLCPLIEVD